MEDTEVLVGREVEPVDLPLGRRGALVEASVWEGSWTQPWGAEQRAPEALWGSGSGLECGLMA